MAKLLHEIWETMDGRGQVLPALGLAGPDGDSFRKLLHEHAREDGFAPPRCVRTFEAENNFDAMTIYYQHYGWGAYPTDFASDRERYPEEWARRQGIGAA